MSIGTIIIPAHNEEAVIGRTLAALSDVVSDGDVKVIVACNGCTDRTAEIARGFVGVEVVEVSSASKTAGLRAGDARATDGPRIYLDADVLLTARAARDLNSALSHGDLAGRPPHRFDTTGASWVVRRWYRIRQDLPSISGALWGAGCYAMSADGRERFKEFPDIVSDDLFVDRVFAGSKTTIVDTDPVVVTTPRRTADLVRILRRSYRTQREVQSPTAGLSPGQKGQLSDLARLLRRDPSRTLDAVVYAVVVSYARLMASVGSAQRPWERDVSSRS